MLLSEALVLFKIEYIALRGLSSSSEENYELAVTSFTRALEDMSIAEITPQHILRWRRAMEKRCKPGTIRMYLSKLKNLLQFTNKKGLTSFEISDIYLPKLPQSLPKYLYDYEVEQMLEQAGSLRNQCIILLMFTSGIRAGELSNLNRGDLDNKALYIRKGKGNTSRVIFMSGRTRDSIDRYLKTREDSSNILFRSAKGGRLVTQALSLLLKTIAKEAGITKPVHSHVMRHSCATHMVRNGVDTSFVQKQLGHAFISTTQLYVHLTNSDLEAAHQSVFA